MGELTDKVTGTATEATGTVTGTQKLRREGKVDQFSGDVKGKANDARDALSDKVDDARDKLHREQDKRED
jgi:uncharacterized protein YjbJ (UPF0337 family)